MIRKNADLGEVFKAAEKLPYLFDFTGIVIGNVGDSYFDLFTAFVNIPKIIKYKSVCVAGAFLVNGGVICLEIVEEDVALCEFVDPSKMELQALVRDGINLMIKEM